MFRDSPLHQLARRLAPECLYPRHLIARAIDRRYGRTVASGPFRGMRYVDQSVGSVFYPKLLGCYEKELHPAVESVIAAAPERVIDIGAAEGYYAVGLALRLPATPVIAYEQDSVGRELLWSMAQMNGVADRITIRGRCTPAALAADLAEPVRTAVVCDVEGGEAELLDPAAVPGLARATFLVELHEFSRPGVAELTMKRLQATHRTHRIWQEPRSVADYPASIPLTRWLPAAYGSYHVQEFRPERMSWLHAEPKTVIVRAKDT